MAVTVTEHQCQRVRCPDCDQTTARLPAQIAASCFGARLQAAIVTLSVRNGISRVASARHTGDAATTMARRRRGNWHVPMRPLDRPGRRRPASASGRREQSAGPGQRRDSARTATFD